MEATHDPLLIITAGVVSLAFFVLIAFVVWRLSVATPTTMGRVLIALGGVLGELAVIVYALAELRG
ncbi:hypothetical protein CLV43_11075 [Umezawaea tangerina]|uniref:Uncharacterized protein n=1 Tax=Umezawaea tangerina TaxID=84725 RepID=A0A2T0SV17_9PSEU|nr:hypothetical protein CLV43_11075 [Umezawaea tangerina]